MRARNLVCALAIVVLGLSGVASATLVVYDHFEGTTLDTVKWSPDPSPPWVAPVVNGDSTVTIGGGGTWCEIQSNSHFAGDNIFEWKLAGGTLGGSTLSFGLLGMTDGNSAQVRNDTGWRLNVSIGGVVTTGDVFTPAAGDTYDLVRGPSSFDLYQNGTLVSTVAKTSTGTADLYMGSAGPGTTRWDYVGTTTSIVPEPSTFVLLGAGLLSLLAYAWRKRR